jgi:hypothetical protein
MASRIIGEGRCRVVTRMPEELLERAGGHCRHVLNRPNMAKWLAERGEIGTCADNAARAPRFTKA